MIDAGAGLPPRFAPAHPVTNAASLRRARKGEQGANAPRATIC
ncbi:hypothetical protein SAMN05444169_7568 [Bradyrhizobium erythrophlei]|uniref:Uncharacterized protein n=1 Tax=Bradyrhizobium erythrophlei TaxID=1437360 RepID=A0A1M5T5I6_9BRAD|nr:hypothetical protein SAMN05444169_7568 [Bradyrhizobium erythrophlei]